MRLPQLDERLSKAAALFPACDYGADIGADHGRLSCYLLANGICGRICTADVSADSLEKARRLLALHGLSERADFAVGDGLSVLPRPADAIAVLGMGGRTVSGILTRGKDRLHGAALILSAHTEMPLLRQTLSSIGYRIETEEIAFAAGRFYVVLRAVPGEERLSERQAFLGPRLTEGCCQHYDTFLAWRKAAAACGKTERAQKETAWIEEEIQRVYNGQADRSDHQ